MIAENKWRIQQPSNILFITGIVCDSDEITLVHVAIKANLGDCAFHENIMLIVNGWI